MCIIKWDHAVFFYFFLIFGCGLQDLSSPTRDWIQAQAQAQAHSSESSNS